jgi:hypothetical protein
MHLAPNGEARFRRPDGRLLPEAPALPALPGQPVAALVSRLAGHGVAVDGGATLPSWDGGPVDYNWAIDWLRWVARRPAPAAREALDPLLAARPLDLQGSNAFA